MKILKHMAEGGGGNDIVRGVVGGLTPPPLEEWRRVYPKQLSVLKVTTTYSFPLFLTVWPREFGQCRASCDGF